MSCSRRGTASRFTIMPHLPFALISAVEQEIPAAPMSCMPTTQPLLINSNVASRSNFSANGSPTCTVGLMSSVFSSNSLEASNDAPWMPSLPVELPMIITLLPLPSEIAEHVSPTFTMPTAIAFTRGLSV